MLKTSQKTEKTTTKTSNDNGKVNQVVARNDEETYRSIKDGEIKITKHGRKLAKLYRKALADD